MSTSSSCTRADSHSNLSRLHLNRQHQPDSSHTPTSPTLCPWFKDNEYNLGNKVLRLQLPIHTSSQNLILSPHPNFHPISLWNHPSPSPSLHTLSKSLHHHDWSLIGICTSEPYFESSSSFHLPFSSEMYLHLHIARRAALNFRIFLLSILAHNFPAYPRDRLLLLPPTPEKPPLDSGDTLANRCRCFIHR